MTVPRSAHRRLSDQRGWRAIAWLQLLSLAQADGWTALYDPTNPNTRTLREDNGDLFIEEIADGLGNLPPAVQETAVDQPRLIIGKFGLLDAIYDGSGGSGPYLVSDSYASAITQPLGAMGIYEREGTIGTLAGLFGLGTISGSPRVNKLSGSTARLGPSASATIDFEAAAGTEVPHTFFANYDGSNGEAWLDGVMTDSGNIGSNNATRTVLMERGDVTGNSWAGFCGPLLIYDGTLSADKRNRMFDLFHALTGIAKAM